MVISAVNIITLVMDFFYKHMPLDSRDLHALAYLCRFSVVDGTAARYSARSRF